MADDDAPQTLAEMTANLAEYKEQLEQVRASPPRPIHRFDSPRTSAVLTALVPASQVERLLVAEPENAEYVELKAGLVEVIAMTEDLVDGHPDAKPREAGADAKANEADASVIDETVAGALCRVRADGAESKSARGRDGRGARGRPHTRRGDQGGRRRRRDVAPEDVRDASGAAEGKAEEDSEDDFDIVLGAAAGEGEGDGDAARPREVYQGVPAPKRLRVTENSAFSKRTVPDKFKVVDGDDEATRERKRKQAKAFKGKQRMLEKDAEQTAKKNDWQSFQAKVGGKKKTGFMTKKIGSKKGSMFSTKD